MYYLLNFNYYLCYLNFEHQLFCRNKKTFRSGNREVFEETKLPETKHRDG